jgi:hypothetical protein
MFVDYENNVYTKYHKTFSRKCVLENDFFVRTKHMKTFSNYFKVSTKHKKMSQFSRKCYLENELFSK